MVKTYINGFLKFYNRTKTIWLYIYKLSFKLKIMYCKLNALLYTNKEITKKIEKKI